METRRIAHRLCSDQLDLPRDLSTSVRKETQRKRCSQGALETFIQIKTDLRFAKGAQKVQGIEEHQLKIN